MLCPLVRARVGGFAALLPCGPAARLPYAGPLRAPDPQGDSFYGERVTRKPGGGKSPATPLRSPTPPREKVSLRSPLSDGGKASSGTELPIQDATTKNRSPPWVLIDKPPGHQQSGLPQDITTGSLACGYHPYSSKHSAGTCPTSPRPNLIKLDSNPRESFFVVGLH